ncbi:hypothetical protein COCSADRAFT_85047 [Bipolaris sorokiniana ND90Pr]|uniref:Rhodopsin domain-containing protein n=1 Tax=Cochliobolus sativus (strain ND90Pr / ATCC 201652) TaxID=665912 RepID=M2TBT1_COCSN|nr:uncharacterized protein COCSADRAFT_85047 [Bipolaris sorokiniana ND90Pr]EMD66616.1 hypothetical protein COCSADRAFT_85047 [Bipolaris sorokiniana ND90Pr]
MSSPLGNGTSLFGDYEFDISQFNFQDHSSNVPFVRITCTIIIVLVLVTVALRIVARLKYVHKIFFDDVLIIFAALFTVALAAACIVSTTHGLGQHIWVLPLLDVLEKLKSIILDLYICQILYACAIALTKLAIISSYFRFVPDQKFHTCMYVTMFPVVGLWITGVFVTFFQCLPYYGAWDFTVERKCIDYIAYLYASSAVNVITDIALCVLPLPYFWRLDMSRKQRIILCMLLGGGASACILGVTRIGFLHNLHALDITYESAPCLILSVSECSLGIISVSIPAIRPLARQLFPTAMRGVTSPSSRARTQQIRLSSVSPSGDRVPMHTDDKQKVSVSYGSSRS